MEQKQPTLWEKLSIFVITGVIVLSVFVCQWLFGMLYPKDSYREYTNWEIVEMTTDNFLTRERITDLAKVIDRKEQKTIWIDRINRLAFSSSGTLIGVDLELLTVEDDGNAQRYHFTLTEGREQAKLIRQEGYEKVESTDTLVPYDTLYTLLENPLTELVNQKPIASQSQFWMIGLGEGDTFPEDGKLSGWEEDWLVRAGALTLSENDGSRTAVENIWFVRKENGWFAVTDWSQVSPKYLPLEVFAYHGEDSAVFAEHYGTILLEA